MLPNYADIRALTDREPDWFDGNGVPRFAPFEPRMLDVYDRYALLVKIQCQSCHRPFLVGDGWTPYDLFRGPETVLTFEDIAAGFHYGDPPAHGCVGDTMNCIDVQIVEAWEHDGTGWEWKRRPDIEAFDITQGWAVRDGERDA